MTDGTWRVRKGAWLPGTQRDLEGDLVDYTENIDGPVPRSAGTGPASTTAPGQPATVIGPAGTAPWTHLVSVRTRIVEEPVHAVSLTRLPSGAVVADFGKVYAAVPTVTFHHGVAGRRDHDARGLPARRAAPGEPAASRARCRPRTAPSTPT